MNKNIVRASLVAISVITTSVAAWAASGWTSATPTQVWVGFTDKSVFVTGLSNKASCSNATTQFSPSWTDADKIESVAIAAFLSGKTLNCYVNGCSGNFQKGFDCKLSN